ncbi:MAG: DnaJ domain-containing protein [Nitrospirae bacterium]|nr:DnaJ domain-containing protein [Nitrospirota bacterium]
MGDIEKYYDILGVKLGASLKEIKQAYRDSIKVWHPDRFAHEDERFKKKAEDKTKEINAAYNEILEHLVSQNQRATESSTSSDSSGQEETKVNSTDEQKETTSTSTDDKYYDPDTKYNLIFTGEILSGYNSNTAKEQLCEYLKIAIDSFKAKRIFANQKVILFTYLSITEAKGHRDKIAGFGIVCLIEEATGQTNDDKSDSKADTTNKESRQEGKEHGNKTKKNYNSGAFMFVLSVMFYVLFKSFGLHIESSTIMGNFINGALWGAIAGGISGAIGYPITQYIKKMSLINISKAKMINIISWIGIFCFFFGMSVLAIKMKDNKALTANKTNPPVSQGAEVREAEQQKSIKQNNGNKKRSTADLQYFIENGVYPDGTLSDVNAAPPTDNLPSKYVGEQASTTTKGTLTYPNGNKYVGEYKDGQPNGHGTGTWPDGSSYVGEWKNGMRNGHGTESLPDGSIYVGEWKEDKPNGHGTETLSDGSNYVGEWKDGKHNGHGTATYPNGLRYVGEFKDGERNGHGTMTYPMGGNYDGEWKDGMRNGYGTVTYPDGSKNVGEWKDGDRIR